MRRYTGHPLDGWKLAVSRSPALRALLAHLLALALAWGLLLAAHALGVQPGMLASALAQGALAALIGARLGLSCWWLPINLGFLPALVGLFWWDLSPLWPLAGFLGLLLLNWNALRERVPLYLTGRPTEARLAAELAALPASFRFVDLGCGLAGTLTRLARRYPQARFTGVETAPLSFLLAWLRCLPLGNCQVRYRSLWRVELGDYDLAYCFLSPAPMPALWRKARQEMRPGAWLVSNSFEVPGVVPQRMIEIGDWRASRLLLYRPGDPGAPAAAVAC